MSTASVEKNSAISLQKTSMTYPEAIGDRRREIASRGISLEDYTDRAIIKRDYTDRR
jgi:hypothetical protein